MSQISSDIAAVGKYKRGNCPLSICLLEKHLLVRKLLCRNAKFGDKNTQCDP